MLELVHWFIVSDLHYRGLPSKMWLHSWTALYLCAEEGTPPKYCAGNWSSSAPTYYSVGTTQEAPVDLNQVGEHAYDIPRWSPQTGS
ncbi:unnamed protein product [Aspergillus oryzae]|uniref:Unnamed protein product n=2 Tax=Aspergillus oryzae TaxID=5062 RepID=A0AAN4YBY8_ASPOZ|nr:unnamed protein product [Aspergillus oryzae]GMF92184.1 unnamed protein product [Aspergillus oryzae]GMG15715.1 unnamed protein product [Aspergillus oryzae]GMG26730.1 unnamed protein product [Aspergillus oryzae]GMG52921.1 unnamed protein product [Aspergillus oryzae var. brunneus]